MRVSKTDQDTDKIVEDVNNLMHEISAMKCEIHALSEDVIQLRNDIHGLVVAWNTTTGVAIFIKWLAATVVATALVYNFVLDKLWR